MGNTALTFATGDGKVTSDFGASADSGYSVAVQADGKILVAGTSAGDFALARYNSDGSLDASFSGDGMVTTDFGSSADSGYSVTTQADGKILVAGYSAADFAVVRYNSDASLDTAFSGDGKVTTNLGSASYEGLVGRVLADDRIQIGGYSYKGGGSYAFALVYYRDNGSLDSTVAGTIKDSSGFVFSDGGHGVAAQTDSKVLVAGSNGGDFALVRYNSDRTTLDTSFGNGGTVTTDLGSASDNGRGVIVQADGKILVAGYSAGDFALVRYNTDGTLDTTFSGDGKLTTDLGSAADHGQSVAVQADGKILVAGSSNGDFALVRYKTDGSLDGGDQISGTAGNDILSGGAGIDTAIFSGNRSNYTITKTTTGYKVIDNANHDGIDTLTDIELIQFTDQTIDTRVVSAASYETVVQQLYVAYFGRPADSGGLANFEIALRDANAPTDITGLSQAYNTDATIRGYIETFGLSAESARLYTGATADFVTAIYNHVLNRDPNPAPGAGLDFWSEAIDSGRLSKANAALSIMQGAVTNTSTQGLLDAAAVYNKIAVASNFTFNIDTPAEVSGYVGAGAGATARALLQGVNDASNPIGLQSTVASTLSSLAGSSSSPSALAFAGGDAGPITLVGLAEHTGDPFSNWHSVSYIAFQNGVFV